MGGNDFQQGDGRGNSGEHHQQIEQNTEDGAHRTHLLEHVLHGNEQQGRATQSALGIQSETGGDDAQTSHQGYQRIQNHDHNSVLFQVLLLVQIGTVGDHGAHAQRQGEEHLAAGSGQNVEEAGCLGNDAVGHRPAGYEHVLQAVHGAGQGQSADDADDQGHEQAGHTDGADLFDTAADTAHHDDHGDGHEDQAVDDALNRATHESAEYLAAGQTVGAETGTEQVAHIDHHVLDAVAAQCAVEEQNEEGGSDAQPAHPAELLAEDLVGAHSTLTGLAAQSQLAQHDDETAEDSKDQINDQEQRAAAGTHLIGEAPDVAQTDRRTDSSHDESKIGSKAFSFFHCFLSLIS